MYKHFTNTMARVEVRLTLLLIMILKVVELLVVRVVLVITVRMIVIVDRHTDIH